MQRPFLSWQDETEKMIYIQILDDDEHEPDTYFDVELYQPYSVDESKVLAFALPDRVDVVRSWSCYDIACRELSYAMPNLRSRQSWERTRPRTCCAQFVAKRMSRS